MLYLYAGIDLYEVYFFFAVYQELYRTEVIIIYRFGNVDRVSIQFVEGIFMKHG